MSERGREGGGRGSCSTHTLFVSFVLRARSRPRVSASSLTPRRDRDWLWQRRRGGVLLPSRGLSPKVRRRRRWRWWRGQERSTRTASSSLLHRRQPFCGEGDSRDKPEQRGRVLFSQGWLFLFLLFLVLLFLLLLFLLLLFLFLFLLLLLLLLLLLFFFFLHPQIHRSHTRTRAGIR